MYKCLVRLVNAVRPRHFTSHHPNEKLRLPVPLADTDKGLHRWNRCLLGKAVNKQSSEPFANSALELSPLVSSVILTLQTSLDRKRAGRGLTRFSIAGLHKTLIGLDCSRTWCRFYQNHPISSGKIVEGEIVVTTFSSMPCQEPTLSQASQKFLVGISLAWQTFPKLFNVVVSCKR